MISLNFIMNSHDSQFCSLPSPVVDLLAGITQATLVTVVGYPFDLIKSRMQTGNYRGTIDCIFKSIASEGPMVLYRGATAPWISHLMKRPIQYPMAEKLKQYLTGTSNNYLIGGATGAIGPLFGTPLQVVKVGMQTSTRSDFNTWQYVKHIAQTKGLKGFYRGFGPTVMKDTLFGASFLGHYYTLRDYFIKHSASDVPTWQATFISGATAHCATWMLLIPIDNIKTKTQKAGEYRGTLEIIKNTIKAEGTLSLWRGVIPACLRTIPVSGVAMVGYEYIRSALGNLNYK